MDVLKRIDEIMARQHLNDYQLSKLSGLSTSTISNMRKRNTIPSIATLEYICESLISHCHSFLWIIKVHYIR